MTRRCPYRARRRWMRGRRGSASIAAEAFLGGADASSARRAGADEASAPPAKLRLPIDVHLKTRPVDPRDSRDGLIERERNAVAVAGEAFEELLDRRDVAFDAQRDRRPRLAQEPLEVPRGARERRRVERAAQRQRKTRQRMADV